MRRKDTKEKTISLKVSQKMYTKIQNETREKNYKNSSEYIRDAIQADLAKNELSKPVKQRAVNGICRIQTYINRSGDFDGADNWISDALKEVKEVLH